MSGSVLVVDDEMLTRDLLRMMLERAGYEVVEAADGHQALQRVNERKPDLVILDVMMPDIDGYQVCRTLREQESTADLPVLMLSAKTQPEAVAEGLRAGATRYLPKPITYNELIQNVREVIASVPAD